MNINKKMNKAMYILYSVIFSNSAFAVDNTVIVDHATSNRFNAIIECTHVETLPDGTKRCFVGHLGGNNSSGIDHNDSIINPDNPNINNEKCDILTNEEKENLFSAFNYNPLNWCNVKNIYSNASNIEDYNVFPSLAKLNNLTGIYLDASDCAYFQDISLDNFKDLKSLQSLRWSFSHTDFVDLSNMKSLINLNYTNYSSFNLSSNFIFNTSDPNDYNMIKTLLTIPNYKTGKLSGVSIIVDGNGKFTDQEIKDILLNKNIAIENNANQQLKINSWNTIVGKAISSDEASSSNTNTNANNLSITLGANKTYVIYSLDDNDNYDIVNYDLFSSYISNHIYDLDSSKITSDSVDLFFSNILNSTPSDQYQILKTTNNTDKSYSIKTPNLIDQVLILDVTDIKSDSNAITERVANKIKEKLNVNINLFESIPLTLNNFKINSWNKLDPNNQLTSKFKSINYMFKTKLDPNKIYYVTLSSTDSTIFNGQIKDFEKYNMNYDKNIEESFSYSDNEDSYSYIILKGKDLLDISFDNSPNGYIGVFEIPKEKLSRLDQSQFYDALSNGILSPKLVFHDAPTTEIGVTNSFETIQPDRSNTFNKEVTLLPDNTYLIISGGNNGCNLSFNPRLSNQSEESTFVPKPYKDWKNLYSYYVTSGSLDPISIHGSIDSSKSFSPTQFGIFKLDPNYNYHDSNNILNDYVLKLYPNNFLNITDSEVNSVVGKYSSSPYNLVNNDYYPIMSKNLVYHIKAGKYYAFTTFVSNNTKYPAYYFHNSVFEQNYKRLNVVFNQIAPFFNSNSKSFNYGLFKAPKDENIMIKSGYSNENNLNMPVYTGLFEFDTEPKLKEVMNTTLYENADLANKF